MATAYVGLNGTAEHSMLGWMSIVVDDETPLKHMVVDWHGWDEDLADELLDDIAYERVGPWVSDGKDRWAATVAPEGVAEID